MEVAMSRVYFAYGSNMNPAQMKRRCPDSRALAKARIRGYRLTINARGVATIVPDETASVSGILWKISKTDEFNLDHFEGVKAGKYEKKKMRISVGKDSASALVYVDCVSDAGIPREGYLEKIIFGAKFFGLGRKYISNLERLAYA